MLYKCARVHVGLYVYVYAYVLRVRVRVRAYLRVCVHLCMCVCMCVYAHTREHVPRMSTHTHSINTRIQLPPAVLGVERLTHDDV